MADPIDIVCGTCGSRDVSRDAWADWEVNSQQWVLRVAFDYAHCHVCDCETRLEELPLALAPGIHPVTPALSRGPPSTAARKQVDAGPGGGCPIVVFGISNKLYVED